MILCIPRNGGRPNRFPDHPLVTSRHDARLRVGLLSARNGLWGSRLAKQGGPMVLDRLRAIGGSESFRSQPSIVYRRQYVIQRSTRVSDQSRPMRSSTTRMIRMTPITPMPP
jgi:hypothetical protein